MTPFKEFIRFTNVLFH